MAEAGVPYGRTLEILDDHYSSENIVGSRTPVKAPGVFEVLEYKPNGFIVTGKTASVQEEEDNYE